MSLLTDEDKMVSREILRKAAKQELDLSPKAIDMLSAWYVAWTKDKLRESNEQ